MKQNEDAYTEWVDEELRQRDSDRLVDDIEKSWIAESMEAKISIYVLIFAIMFFASGFCNFFDRY